MALTTRVATPWAARMIIMTGACIVFALWGYYDLKVKIPRERDEAQRFKELSERRTALEEQIARGAPLDEAQLADAQRIAEELAPFGGRTPSGPASYDPLVCWLFMSCLPMAPFFLWRYLSARAQHFTLEDDGTLVTRAGRWPAAEIAGIDMNRWMSKSIARVAHRDGRSVVLDDHVHRGTDLIVGALAQRFDADAWDERARPKPRASSTEAGEPAAPPAPGA